MKNAWWLMKLSDDGQQVIWVRDQPNPGAFDIAQEGNRLYINDGGNNTTFRRLFTDSRQEAEFTDNAVPSGFGIWTTGASSKRLFTTYPSSSNGVYSMFREADGTPISGGAITVGGEILNVNGVGASDSLYINAIHSGGCKLRSYSGTRTAQWDFNIGGGTGVLLMAKDNGSQAVAVGSPGNPLDVNHIPPVASTRAFSLGGSLNWHANHGTQVNCVGFCPNGNVITGGYPDRFRTGGDGNTTRVYDSSGNYLWGANHEGAAASLYGVWAVCSDDSNNVYTGGELTMFGGDFKMIRKYDSSGSLQWSFDYTLGKTSGNYRIFAIYWADGYIYCSGTRVVYN